MMRWLWVTHIARRRGGKRLRKLEILNDMLLKKRQRAEGRERGLPVVQIATIMQSRQTFRRSAAPPDILSPPPRSV